MPDTPLTKILRDFRSYRPGNHREFLEWMHDAAEKANLKNFALEDPDSAEIYLHALDQVRDFRWRHWSFTKQYILKHTKHRTATGGSPIVTWLPNQLEAVLDQISETAPHCKEGSAVKSIIELAKSQKEALKKEVELYCKGRND
jgi:indoleamine 2,3-dioxygenase